MINLDRQVYTAQELSDWWNVSPRTIVRLVEQGEISAVRVGRQYRFKKEDVERFMENNMSYPKPAD